MSGNYKPANRYLSEAEQLETAMSEENKPLNVMEDEALGNGLIRYHFVGGTYVDLLECNSEGTPHYKHHKYVTSEQAMAITKYSFLEVK
jgi:hypothetical protein